MTTTTTTTPTTPAPLGRYLAVRRSPPEPGGQEACYRIGDRWLVVRVPLARWEPAARRRWGGAVQLLTSPRAAGRAAGAARVCLCRDLPGCAHKPPGQAGRAHAGCPAHAFGLCVAATLRANGGRPPGFETVAALCGVSKQRVHERYRAAQRRLRAAVADDPVLGEYCAERGIGRRPAAAPRRDRRPPRGAAAGAEVPDEAAGEEGGDAVSLGA